MELRQLEYVVAIADTGGFTRAGERCHVAQSALSRQVAQLEAELGVRLFHRTTREVRLTGAGHAFVPAARRVLAEAIGARAAVDAAARVYRGQVRLGATQAASGSLDLAGLLGEFRRRFPDATVLITAGPRQELLDAVAAGDLDLALAADGDAAPEGMRFQALLTDEPLVAVVSPDDELAGRASVSLAQIAAHGACVEFRPGTELRRRMDAAFLARGLTRTIAYELGQLTEMVRFARAGLGTAIVPRSFTAGLAAPAGRTAGVLDLTDPGLTMTLGAYTRPDAVPPAAGALVDLGVARPPRLAVP
jgi:DNA-binding transcriptional LysR family regulator